MPIFVDERAFRTKLKHDLDIDPVEEGEPEYIRHHWLVLVTYLLIPLVPALIFGGLALYRGIGGQFISRGIDVSRLADRFNLALFALVILLGFFWANSESQPRKKKTSTYFNPRVLYPIAMAVLLLIVALRSAPEGRILWFDSLAARPFDTLNQILIAVTVVSLFGLVLAFQDWAGNVLILTQKRVLYSEDLFFFRRARQEIFVDDIQQVLFLQNTYPSVIFRYGFLTIQSFSQRRIQFNYAANARQMQDAIQKRVNEIRKRQSAETLRRLIESNIYDAKTPETPAGDRPDVTRRNQREIPILAWLFPMNPQENPATGEIVWRPATIYVAFQLFYPVGTFVVLSLLLFVGLNWGVLSANLALGLWLLVLLVVAAWVFWQREELVNDIYILRRNQIVDVDKRPFGPEDRRSAPIDRIQNISFDTNLIENVLGYGTVKIQTGGSGEFTFNHVPNPQYVQTKISQYLADYRKADKERQLQDTLSVVKEYHRLRSEKEPAVTETTLNERIDTRVATEMPRYVDETLQQQIAGALSSEITGRMRRMVRRTARIELYRMLRGRVPRRGE